MASSVSSVDSGTTVTPAQNRPSMISTYTLQFAAAMPAWQPWVQPSAATMPAMRRPMRWTAVNVIHRQASGLVSKPMHGKSGKLAHTASTSTRGHHPGIGSTRSNLTQPAEPVVKLTAHIRAGGSSRSTHRTSSPFASPSSWQARLHGVRQDRSPWR